MIIYNPEIDKLSREVQENEGAFSKGNQTLLNLSVNYF